ncbi:MAG: 6-phosphofructokinase [Eubacterium sp.]|nr:6-phosphofructokinase [Eubacterium sp.]
MKRKKNLVIAHGGGPTAVINASLYGAVSQAQKAGCFGKILGAVHGINGVFSEHFIDLTDLDSGTLNLLLRTPSSAIGSCRRKLTDEDYPVLLEILERNNVGYFIYNGGNDSMDTCYKMAELAKKTSYDLVVAGIPKTIDNDLGYTDHCPGYGSAARFLAANIRDLRCEERALPIYPMIIETMGRNAGWLTAAASMAQIGGRPCADLIYLPEYAYDEEKFLSDIDNALRTSPVLVVVVSEGFSRADGKPIADTGFVDGFGHSVPGGTAQALAQIVHEKLGIQTRYEKLGLVGRASGIWQSPVDRDEAAEAGKRAVQLLQEGISGYMVTILRKGRDIYEAEYGTVELEKVANFERKFPLEWINETHNGINEAFLKYAKPLIGEDFSPYVDFGIDCL